MKKRTMPVSTKVMGAMLTMLGSFWPALSSFLAYRIWFSTPRYEESGRERDWREQARSESVKIAGKNIVIYVWGEVRSGYILLLHGWSGRASQLGGFVRPVNELGKAAIGFDAPGHGESNAHTTTIFEIADVVNEIVKRFGSPEAIIAHSFGCLVAALSIRQFSLPVKKLVAISCPTDSHYLVTGFARHFRLNEEVISRFNRKLYLQFGDDVYEKTSADINLSGLSIKLLVVHDKSDQIVPWRLGEKLARAVADVEVCYTDKLDHQRLLRNKDVITRVTQFLAD